MNVFGIDFQICEKNMKSINSDLCDPLIQNQSLKQQQLIKKTFNMYSSIASSINNSQHHLEQSASHLALYESLNQDYCKNGFTYKSNQILHKTSQNNPKICPYPLLLAAAKIYHMNQFETIFFTHVLNESAARKAYDHDHQNIFGLQGAKFPPEVDKMLNQVCEQSKSELGRNNLELFGEENVEENHFHHQDQIEEVSTAFTVDELKKIYLYLLVIGYAIKYYLNEPIKAKPYEEYVNRHIEDFIPGIFNKWARNYGNTALNTTPRKINAYYMGLGFLEGEQEANNQQQAEDCQYRNYNEIVEQLIKATTEGDQLGQINGDELNE